MEQFASISEMQTSNSVAFSSGHQQEFVLTNLMVAKINTSHLSYSLKTPKGESMWGELKGQELMYDGALTGTSQAGRNARE